MKVFSPECLRLFFISSALNVLSEACADMYWFECRYCIH